MYSRGASPLSQSDSARASTSRKQNQAFPRISSRAPGGPSSPPKTPPGGHAPPANLLARLAAGVVDIPWQPRYTNDRQIRMKPHLSSFTESAHRSSRGAGSTRPAAGSRTCCPSGSRSGCHARPLPHHHAHANPRSSQDPSTHDYVMRSKNPPESACQIQPRRPTRRKVRCVIPGRKATSTHRRSRGAGSRRTAAGPRRC
jgi:hypothetical protein